MSKGKREVQACMALMLSVMLVACSDGTSPGEDRYPVPDLQAEEVARGLSIPTHLTAPAGDNRLFVVELHGRVRVVEQGQLLSTPFLDISDRLGRSGEEGLFSVAFHPEFASNGYFYVNYTDRDGHTRIERYQVSSNRNRADPNTVKLILLVEQPTPVHNGGQLAFGPDGKLYIGMGDGGADPGTSQDAGTLLGSLLRIDVDAGDPYAIPHDNPFANHPGKRGEIWAIGLRNPWRFSFDHQAGLLYLTDVGAFDREEVNVVPSSQGGLNYGWNLMEGSLCVSSEPTRCDTAGLVLPTLEYSNYRVASDLDHPDGCAVVGGYVYRGRRMPGLQGHYLYSDLCRNWFRSFRLENGLPTDQQSLDFGSIGGSFSFGQDAAGELYILADPHGSGTVYRIVPVDWEMRG